jgi:phage/plasmid primase-like uncharacterized protein
MSAAVHDFLGAMREHGLEPVEEIIADGALHRVRWRGDKSSTRNGAYVLHVNGAKPSGWVQCFKRGIKFTWCAKSARLSPAERRALTSQIAEERKRRQREERERHELVAKQAQATLEACQDADPEHAYLERKGVETHGLKVDAAGRLVVPSRDPKGTTWSLQTIAPDGAKLFLKGGRKSSLFHLLGEPGDRIVIAEGFATAASIREATGLSVVIAFDCSNLVAVGKAIRGWLPLSRIVIAADDDHATEGNPGLNNARAAAELIGAAVAVPTFPDGIERGTDFNDLASRCGHQPVAEAIQVALDELADVDAYEGDDPKPLPGASAATAQDASSPRGDGREEIRLSEEEFNAIVRRGAKLLQDTIYLRGASPFAITRAAEIGSGRRVADQDGEAVEIAGVLHRPGALVFTGATRERAAFQLDELVLFYRFDRRADDWLPTTCPPKLAQRIIGVASDLGFRPCAGISRTPLFIDGEVITTPGWDPRTRLLLDPPTDLPPVPAMPSKAEAEQAWRRSCVRSGATSPTIRSSSRSSPRRLSPQRCALPCLRRLPSCSTATPSAWARARGRAPWQSSQPERCLQ